MESWNPRHLRQPSKSIRACMQPHSVTFCDSQGNPTGYERAGNINTERTKWVAAEQDLLTLVKKSLHPAANAS